MEGDIRGCAKGRRRDRILIDSRCVEGKVASDCATVYNDDATIDSIVRHLVGNPKRQRRCLLHPKGKAERDTTTKQT
jgi:hypothetical protein